LTTAIDDDDGDGDDGDDDDILPSEKDLSTKMCTCFNLLKTDQ